MQNHPTATYEEYPEGGYHDFWLLHEDEHEYRSHTIFWGRKDAPVRIPNVTLEHLIESLGWLPTVNPAYESLPIGYSLNHFGPTVINAAGAAMWSQIMRGWAQIFATGPSVLRLPSGTYNDKKEDGTIVTYWYTIKIDRDLFVADLLMLAEWGDKAATGDYFILHIGI